MKKITIKNLDTGFEFIQMNEFVHQPEFGENYSLVEEDISAQIAEQELQDKRRKCLPPLEMFMDAYLAERNGNSAPMVELLKQVKQKQKDHGLADEAPGLLARIRSGYLA
jgi:hypothetical protein